MQSICQKDTREEKTYAKSQSLIHSPSRGRNFRLFLPAFAFADVETLDRRFFGRIRLWMMLRTLMMQRQYFLFNNIVQCTVVRQCKMSILRLVCHYSTSFLLCSCYRLSAVRPHNLKVGVIPRIHRVQSLQYNIISVYQTSSNGAHLLERTSPYVTMPLLLCLLCSRELAMLSSLPSTKVDLKPIPEGSLTQG